MKRLAFFSAVLAALFLSACSGLDLAPESSPDRIINGTVVIRTAVPAGAEVTVRLVDLNARETTRNPLSEMTTTAPQPATTERIVAEKTFAIGAQTTEAIPFQLAYSASEAELRHGLNLEARISHGGKVRHRTINAHVVTLSSAPFPHELTVEPLP